MDRRLLEAAEAQAAAQAAADAAARVQGGQGLQQYRGLPKALNEGIGLKSFRGYSYHDFRYVL